MSIFVTDAHFARHNLRELDNAGMSDNRATRPWFRWSAITWLVLVATAGALINVNLRAGRDGGIEFLPPPPRKHGWPGLFLERTASGQQQAGPLRLALDYDNDRALSISPNYPSRWPFDSTPVTRFTPWILIVDVTIGLTILILAGLAVERWSRCQSNSDRFSLKTLLSVVAWTATCTTLALHRSLGWDLIVSHVSVAVLVISIGLAWAGCLDCLGFALGGASRCNK